MHMSGNRFLVHTREFMMCRIAVCLLVKVIRCADAGADLVRITVQGRREARACKQIREKLNEKVPACLLHHTVLPILHNDVGWITSPYLTVIQTCLG